MAKASSCNLSIKKELLNISGGHFCEQTGLAEPSGLCDSGFYCSGGSKVAAPSGLGGNMCLNGTYCPEGSSSPTPCDPGKYCSTDQLATSTGFCLAGYFCSAGAVQPDPTDGTTGTHNYVFNIVSQRYELTNVALFVSTYLRSTK